MNIYAQNNLKSEYLFIIMNIKKGEINMNEKLLPCPFCGGEARLTKLNQKGFNGEFKVFVQCSRCKARSKIAYPLPHYSLKAREEVVTKAWNNRVPTMI